jgi:tetratricopeptide (TPR) repeat protein
MITSAATANDFRQLTPNPQFVLGIPRLNPLAPDAPLSITQLSASLAIDWHTDSPEESQNVATDLVERLIGRSRREVSKRPNSARAHANLGISLMNSGDIDNAIAEFETALRLDHKHYVAATSLARIKVQGGDFEGAEHIYSDLQTYYPNNSTLSLSRAQIAMRRRDYVQSEKLLREAIQLGHRAITARYYLAMVLLKLGHTREAIAELRSAIRSEVRAPFLYQGLGAAYAVNGDLRRAVTAFKTALSLAPGSSGAAKNLAHAYLDLHEPEQASDLLTEFLERNPSDFDARELLARAYHERKQFRSAIAQLTHVDAALQRQPIVDRLRRGRIANNIGVAYLNEGDLKQAENWLQSSITLAADCGPLAFGNLARVYLRRDELGKAIATLDRGRAKFPEHEDTTVLLALALERSCMYDEAINLLTPLVAQGNATEQVYADLGWLLTDAKRDYPSALKVLREGYERFKQDGLLVNNLAYAHLMCGNVVEARNLLEKGTELLIPNSRLDSSSRIVLTATWGLLLVAEGDLEGGEQLYRKAHKMALEANQQELASAAFQKMHLELARAFARTGNHEMAKRHVHAGLAVRRGRLLYQEDLRNLEHQLI